MTAEAAAGGRGRAADALAKAVDLLLEATVVGGHTRIGSTVRRRIEGWPDPVDGGPLDGRRFVVTGATSGIGHSVATALARAGATVHSASRSPEHARDTVAEIARVAGNDRIDIDVVDLARPGEAHDWGTGLAAQPVDGVVHVAGAYFPTHTVTADDIEANAAVYIVGPYALTAALAPALVAADGARIITVSSSGAYAAGLRVDRLEPDPDGYRPLRAYAHAKRAQIALTTAWHHHLPDTVACHAVTPGWCDTDLVRQGLPRFREFFRPILRDAGQGADTAIWLAAHDVEPDRLWRDRHPRWKHRLPWTVGGDDAADLWAWCAERSGYRFPSIADRPSPSAAFDRGARHDVAGDVGSAR